ncbi:MAG: hypothetical protein AAGL69_15860 [Pseudomonadota bacterium]
MTRRTTISKLTTTTAIWLFAISAAHARVVVNRDQNVVYHLDCATGLILCTSAAFESVEELEEFGFDAQRWRQHRTRTSTSIDTPLVGPPAWLPSPKRWLGVSNRGTTALKDDESPALASLSRQVVDELTENWRDDQRGRLDHVALQLELRSRDIDLPSIMNSVAGLFDTDVEKTPDIVLIATDHPSLGSVATRAGHTLFVESPRHDTGRSRLPVVAHEWTHHLFERMSGAVSDSLLNAFEKSGSACATPAYHLLEEVLATAVGDGIVAAQLFRDADDTAYLSTSESFYADADIDAMAKAVVPLLQHQLGSGRPLDTDFAAQYLELAERVLSARCNDLQARLRMSAIVQTSHDYDAAYQLLRDRLAIRTALIDVTEDLNSHDTALTRYTGLTGVVLSDIAGLDRLAGIADLPTREALKAVASAEGAAVLALPRNQHAEVYFIVGKNPAATSLAAVHFIAHRRQRFSGWWLPLREASIPERNE